MGRAGEGRHELAARTTNFWAPCLTAIVGTLFTKVQLAG